MYVPNHIAASDETRRRETERMCRELRVERPGDYRGGRTKTLPMKNKLEIKRTRRFPFFKYDWRYTVTAEENGIIISASTQGYSRREDMVSNIRRLYNADIQHQLDALLAKLDA